LEIRGPNDSANIIAIVTEQKNELNRLRTNHGVIEGWFNSSTLQPATSNFINMPQVNKAKELSLREIVALTTGGQSFHRCNRGKFKLNYNNHFLLLLFIYNIN